MLPRAEAALTHDEPESLEAVAETVTTLLAVGDVETLGQFIRHHPAEFCCAVHPEKQRGVCAQVIAGGGDPTGELSLMHAMMLSTPERSQAHEDPPRELSGNIEAALLVGQLFFLRTHGGAEAALPLLDGIEMRGDLQTVYDDSAGSKLMLQVQCGTTAMLAGELQRALSYFTTAQLQMGVRSLPMLTRDAHAKIALIHATFGDPERARSALALASALPRTSSWIEPLVDAIVLMVDAVLDEDPASGLEKIDRVVLSDLSQMWPFYLRTIHRILARAHRWDELADRVRLLERVPFPRTSGSGFTGSAFPAVNAHLHLVRGNVAAARGELRRADPNCFLSDVIATMVESAAGQPQRVIEAAMRLAQPSEGLRQVRSWRYAALTDAYLQLGQADEALQALRTAHAINGEVRRGELSLFNPRTLSFAAENVDGWPEPPIADTSLAFGHSLSAPQLTPREQEILQLLSDGQTRTQMAAQMFVSVNTVKTQLRSLYRKLGVTTRDSALLRAEREGLISADPQRP
ncbi:MAG: LuxR C-terminal-related transcriptional regulator [Microbacterium sp.]